MRRENGKSWRKGVRTAGVIFQKTTRTGPWTDVFLFVLHYRQEQLCQHMAFEALRGLASTTGPSETPAAITSIT